MLEVLRALDTCWNGRPFFFAGLDLSWVVKSIINNFLPLRKKASDFILC